jgi:hypothetical protein
MALPDHHHRWRASSVGATDEQCLEKGARESLAWQSRVVSADRGVLERRLDVLAAAVAHPQGP